MATRFRYIETTPGGSSSAPEVKLDQLEHLIGQAETDGYEFHSLTFVGPGSGGALRFVVAFRKSSSSSTDKQ